MNETFTFSDLLIIGGGVAGLAAAQAAQNEGAQVTLLEAQSKLGGRVRTEILTSPSPDQKLTVEMGAEWIGDNHTEVKRIADRAGLQLVEHRFNYGLIAQGHSYPWAKDLYTPQTVDKIMFAANMVASLPSSERARLQNMTYRDFLISQELSPMEMLLEDRYKADAYGEDIDHLPALNVLEDTRDDVFETEDAFRIVGGNNRLVEAMATGLENNIFLNKKIVKVEQDNGVTVYTADGSMFHGRKTLITLPPAAILDIDWAPKLPEAQAEAFKNLQFAQILKLAAVFRQRIWDRDDFAVLVDSMQATIYHATQNQPGKKGVLMAYVVGNNANRLARFSEKDQRQAFNEALHPLFGDINKYIESMHAVNWGDDPFSRGAYSVFHGGYRRQRRIMARPHGDFYFAGEHLPRNFAFQGFMEGAIRSAREAVKQALA